MVKNPVWLCFSVAILLDIIIILAINCFLAWLAPGTHLPNVCAFLIGFLCFFVADRLISFLKDDSFE